MKTAIIKITPEKSHIDVQTNGCSYLDLLDCLNVVMKSLAKEVIKEARKHVGDDPDAQAKWIDAMRQKYGLN